MLSREQLLNMYLIRSPLKQKFQRNILLYLFYIYNAKKKVEAVRHCQTVSGFGMLPLELFIRCWF